MEIPVLDRTYPVRQSPHYSATATDFHRWMAAKGPYRTPAALASFAAKDYVYLASIAFPACNERLLWEFSGVCATMSEQDDDWADHWDPLIAEIWTRLASHIDPRQMSRLTDAVSAYKAGTEEYERKLIQGDIPQDVGSYLQSRYLTIGQLIDHVLIEISLGIDVSDSLSDPLMAELVRCDVERVIACQDVLSLHKELHAGEHENLVHVIAAETGCGRTEAVAQACVFFKDANARTDRAADAVLASPLGRRRDIRQFVRGLNDFVAGLIEWTSCSTRYTLADTSEWITPTVPYRQED
ncbi:terpene synthase family protein [Lentzea sp. NPDC051838]|uniref:terpene synthase family protein n=1 Tax=Lentzea sp. NPDC051838 TaxID=3154849 RepID=UPI00344780EA